jgi:hypothetical protein
LLGAVGTAEECRKSAGSFDHFVGAGEQRGRHSEAEHPGCLKKPPAMVKD